MTAQLGFADTAIFNGDFPGAVDAFVDGIALAEAAGSQYYLATMRIGLAEALYLADGERAEVEAMIDAALTTSAGLPRQVPAALLYLELGDIEAARAIATELAAALQHQSRAYGALINGLIELQDESQAAAVAAIDRISAGLEQADLWLLRFYRGIAYLEAGFAAEALDEFTACYNRRGEASAIFLDDLPTFRYVAVLPYWQGRAQMELGMLHDARQNFMTFVARRPEGEPLADDARQRLQSN
jgi:hypothetical protein